MARYGSTPGIFIGNNIFGDPIEYSYISSEKIGFEPGSTVPNSNGKFYFPTRWQVQWTQRKPGTVVQDFTYAGYAQVKLMPAFPSWYWGWGSKFVNEADCGNIINRALADSAESEMDLSETIGGAKESFEMIAKRSKQIKTVMKAVKQRRFIDAVEALYGQSVDQSKLAKVKKLGQGGSSFYLEFLFGWVQLFTDVYVATKLIHAAVNSDDSEPNGIVTGFSADSVSRTYHGWPNYPSTWGSSGHKWNLKSAAHCKVRYRFDHPSKGRTFNQLGILNVPSAVWKLSSMSFVADWFIPIGAYLDAFSASTGLQFQHGYCSIYNTASSSASGFSGPIPRRTNTMTVPPSVEMGSHVRFGVGNKPRPPTFTAPDSVMQASIGVALAAQMGLKHLK